MGFDNADRIVRAYATFNLTGEVDPDLFDRSFEHDQSAGLFLDGMFYGAAGVRAAIEEIEADWDDLHYQVDELIALEDRLLVMLHVRARVKDCTSELDAQIAHLWEFRGDRAIRMDEFADRTEALRTLQMAGPVHARSPRGPKRLPRPGALA
jgi:ketosteroid isomerase-like protein